MNRLALFKFALDRAREHVQAWGEHLAIQSIIDQLEYLIGVESGQITDRSRLRNISVGVLAAREIEDRGDMKLADLLHSISEEARRMAAQRG